MEYIFDRESRVLADFNETNLINLREKLREAIDVVADYQRQYFPSKGD